MPLCLALWAKVKEEIDQKLDAQRNAGAPLRLAPQNGTSAKIPWVLLLTGPQELTPNLEHNLSGMLGVAMKEPISAVDSRNRVVGTYRSVVCCCSMSDLFACES